jgi:type I restriction enzyme S subunit
MIDVEQLRSKILDLAISGKLVPQDPNDEPASVLLERIQKEKEALVKTGKIKKADPPSIIYKGSDNRYYEKVVGGSVDVTNEIPFAIPDGWSFVRLKDLVYFGGGKTPSMDVSGNWNPGTTNWVTSKDVKSKTIHESRIKVSDKGAKELALYPASSLVLVMRSGILRHSVPIAILSSPSTVNQDIKVLVPFVSAMMGFIYLFFSASTKFILDHCSKDGTTVESLDSKKVENILLPLPGLDEQKRIVDCSDEVVKKCDSLAQSMRENAGLGAKLKEKILCYFFAKNSDKSYYGQPRRFTALGTLISGRDLIPSQYSNEKRGIPYITGASNFENGSIIVNRWTDQPAVIAKKGDVLITCKGTIGKTAVLQLEECHIARQIMAFRCNKGTLFPKYLQYYFAFLERDLANSSSSLIPGFKREELTKKLVSFPDYKTQIEVAQKIDLLFRRIDSFNDGSSAQ